MMVGAGVVGRFNVDVELLWTRVRGMLGGRSSVGMLVVERRIEGSKLLEERNALPMRGP